MKLFRREKRHYSPEREIEIQLTIADKVSRLVIHSARADELARETLVDLSEFVPVDWAFLALVNSPAGTVRVLSLVGDDEFTVNAADTSAAAEACEPADTVSLDATPFGWVVQNQQALLEPDLNQERRFPACSYGPHVRAVVHMPLFYGDDVFGVLSAGCFTANAYQETELRLLRHVAAHLAVSLKSALLLEQNVATEALLANLAELLGIITSNPELPEVFPRFAGKLREIVPFDRLSLLYREGSIVRVLVSHCERGKSDPVDRICLVDETAIPWMEKNGQIHFVPDLMKEKQFVQDEVRLAEGFRGEIRVPLYHHGKLFASLHLASVDPYKRTLDLALLKELGHYLSTPVRGYLLYQSEKQRFEWLAALAHHMRNPLSPIISSSKLLVEELAKAGSNPLLRAARNISDGAQNLNRNLKLFWDLSEVQSPSFSLALQTLSPPELLHEAAMEMALDRLKLEVPDHMPVVCAEPARLKQVLRILLENARQASLEGNIVLRAAEAPRTDSAPGRMLVVSVSDSGKGFSPEERERFLRPYQIAEADRRAVPEVTLNIAIARRIIELHGGTLSLDSEPGKGATFSFFLPLAAVNDQGKGEVCPAAEAAVG